MTSKVKIKLIDKSLPLPQYHTDGSVGFDLYSRQDITIEQQSIALIPLNVIIQTPPDHVLVLALRSSTPKRKNLLIPNGVGVIDQDYCGPEDEIHCQVYNFGNEAVTIKKGERIAQGIFMPITKANWQLTDSIKTANRGGFGSTGY